MTFAEIVDGTSKTMVVAEQSDYCIDTSDGSKRDCRSDYGHAFCMGSGNEVRYFNLTTIRYGVNEKTWNLKGIGDNYYGSNRPFQSAHPGGATALFADGSVHFLTQALNLQMLYNMANRDDGQPVSF